MKIAGLRSIGTAVLLVLLAGAGCNRHKRGSSESSAAPTPHGIPARITAHEPDAFYDPPSDLPHQPGALLRSEPLKGVICQPACEAGASFMQPLWTTAPQRRRSRQCSRRAIPSRARVRS
jgi:hypothetical protein